MRTINAVKPGDCFDHWHQVTCREFSVTECRHVVTGRFNARVVLKQFGDLELCDIWSSTPADELIEVTRGRAEIRADQRDYFMLWLMMSGKAALTQDDRTAHLQAGDLVVQDQSKPFELRFAREARAAMIKIPRPMLTERVPMAGRMAARRMTSQSKHGAMAGALVQQLFQFDDTTEDEVFDRIARPALDIFGAALEAEFDNIGGDVKVRRRLDEVKQFMLANLHDNGLDVEKISHIENISPRSLYRMFAYEGTTPMRWLWQQRLAGAFNALAEGRECRVTDAALRFGYSDLSHFSRAFKTEFGLSPRDLQRRAKH